MRMQRRVLSIHNADDVAISDISYKNIVVEDAQLTNTPLQVAKVHTDEPDVSTTAPVVEPTTKAQPTTTKAITAGNTTVKSATKKKSAKKVKISLQKVKSAVGYRVQFSTTKKFKKVLVTKNVKKVKIKK